MPRRPGTDSVKSSLCQGRMAALQRVGEPLQPHCGALLKLDLAIEH